MYKQSLLRVSAFKGSSRRNCFPTYLLDTQSHENNTEFDFKAGLCTDLFFFNS